MKRNDVLKIIAMVTMLIDHIGYMFSTELAPLFRDISTTLFNDPLAIQPDILRIIGRFSFPIFAYMIAKGWKHTSSKKNYVIRLSIFALISQVPYAYFGPAVEASWLHLNVIILFVFSLGALYLIDIQRKNKSLLLLMVIFAYISLPLVYELTVDGAMFSYSTYGVLMVWLFYRFENSWSIIFAYLGLTALNNMVLLPIGYTAHYGFEYVSTFYYRILDYTFNEAIQNYSFFGAAIIAVLQRFEFRISLNKYIGYIFYPGHIALLILIKLMIR
jgi:hypothetical protein